MNDDEIVDNKRSTKVLKEFLEKADKQQGNGPFNIRDSGVLSEMHRELEEGAVGFDNEPKAACPTCNSIFLKEIDDKLVCFNCGNDIGDKEVLVYKSIDAYIESADEGS